MEPNDRYLVVSADAHAGPSLTRQLRAYCPPQHLDDFDAYAAEAEKVGRGEPSTLGDAVALRRMATEAAEIRSPLAIEAMAIVKRCEGLQDPDARRRHMDEDGIAAEVIFAGGQNDEVLPFLGLGFGAGTIGFSPDLIGVGCHIWNHWLSDFVSGAPERHVGVMQFPIWDLDAAIEEITWARDAGLRAVNLPAPRRDFPPYAEPQYDRLWAACQDLDLPLVCHSAGGEEPIGTSGPHGRLLFSAEIQWMSRRALWQLILSGVFERFPRLKLVFTEQRVTWVPDALRELDSIALSTSWLPPRHLSCAPSEYWYRHCYLSGSFLAPFEVAQRHEVGLGNLMWGSDYPHIEGTWPNTRLAMRNTFAAVPPEDARRILGETALDVYGLDRVALRAIADRIGPTVEELATAPAEEELPAFRGYAFRELGSFA